MTMRALTIAETAALVGRSEGWLRDNWKLLGKLNAFPPPIHEHGTFVWDPAQVYAWLDRKRPLRERAFAAAFRAAYQATERASDPDHIDEVAAARAKLNRRFNGAPA